jgi:DNA-binding NarL/FixJ family response regulator
METGIQGNFKRSILLISDHGRRQEGLLAILRTLPGEPEIIYADLSVNVETTLAAHRPAFVIIDHTINADHIAETLERVRIYDNQTRILLIVPHPKLTFAYSSMQPDAVLCDGFSSVQLLAEIEKGFATHAMKTEKTATHNEANTMKPTIDVGNQTGNSGNTLKIFIHLEDKL